MTIYQVIYYNQFNEKVADFGFYEDKLDAEKRAFDVRMKTPLESGKVCVEDVFVHDSTDESKKPKNDQHSDGYKYNNVYDLK